MVLRTGGDEAFRKIRDPDGDGLFVLRRLGSGERDAFELEPKLRERNDREVSLKFNGLTPP